MDKNIQKIALQVIKEESNAIAKLSDSINADFISAVETILNSKGRLIVTGIGKSANIATKIVATLNSTGTPAVFMHAADAIHGDLGIVQKDDVVMCISKSGNTPEIKVLIPLVKSLGNPLIANVGNNESFLAKQADFVLNSTVEKEACPNNLAPTSSTTAQLVMGDALAVCLLEMRGFSDRDFAKYHPGGALGKQLYLRVEDLCMNNEKPSVDIQSDIRTVILEISSKRLGATAVIENGKLKGVVTDGDIRRMMQKYSDVDPLKASDIMTANPLTIEKNQLAVAALKIMKEKNITQLLVTDKEKYFGVIHLHDILKEGIL
jgi:arabinose-5-phosphate isomerase